MSENRSKDNPTPPTANSGSRTVLPPPDDGASNRLLTSGIVSAVLNVAFLWGGAAMASRAAEIPPNPPIFVEIRDAPAAPPVKAELAPTPAPEATPAPKPEQPRREARREEPEQREERRREQPRRRTPRPPRQVAMAPKPRPVERPRVTPRPRPETPPEPKPPTPATENNVAESTPARGTPTPTTRAGDPNNPSNSGALRAEAPARLGGGGAGNPALPRTTTTPRGPAGAPGTPGSPRVMVAAGDAKGTPDIRGGEFTVPDAIAARPTGAPSARAGVPGGLIEPSNGGTVRNPLATGSGGATVVSPNMSPARGPVGLPGAAVGPRNRTLTATEKASLDPNGFEIGQGGGIKAGTPIARQGAIGGAIGTPTTGAAVPRYSGPGGSGPGTGVAGIAGREYSPSRGPVGGGSGPLGPRGKSLGYTSGDSNKVGPPGGTPGGLPGGASAFGVAGGTGQPGRGPNVRSTGLGGSPGNSGEGVRLGVRGGTPGAPPGAATSGIGGGRNRGPCRRLRRSRRPLRHHRPR
ncbi:MAG TPA: hypothetical protein VM490_09570, partial [Armatimonadaceae bacterium]|nr:hypothetical protein [Armatimonadaceae bacterium]